MANALEALGASFLIVAGWLVSPVLGLALLGVACLALAYAMERQP